MPKQKYIKKSFLESLEEILVITRQSDSIKFSHLLHILAGKGYAASLIILILPFCFPIQIPGFSTPFGIMLAFIGLRIAFGKKPWWPKWILEKTIQSKHLIPIIEKTMVTVKYLQKILHPRLVALTQNPIAHLCNGLLIFLLGAFLALPLPIPFTNLFPAFPILFIGLGLLEDDGVFILIGYLLGMLFLLFLLKILVFGFSHLLNFL